VSCGTSRVVPGAHRVVGPGTHRGSGPREVHTTEGGGAPRWLGDTQGRGLEGRRCLLAPSLSALPLPHSADLAPSPLPRSPVVAGGSSALRPAVGGKPAAGSGAQHHPFLHPLPCSTDLVTSPLPRSPPQHVGLQRLGAQALRENLK
jgi:hypothetical protein